MKFIDKKTEGGSIKGKISFYCKALDVTREGFRKYLLNKNKPWKYESLAAEMLKIVAEDECNDTYGRQRMYEALIQRAPEGIHIPSERTVYRVMEVIGLSHKKKRKPNGITKAEKEARKSDDLIKRNFKADEPLTKAITDITEIKAIDGKLYLSGIFDCFNLEALGISMDTNMKAPLCVNTLDNAVRAHPQLRGAIIHSDRGSQYTSNDYKKHFLFFELRNF